MINQKYDLSGSQPTETFLSALQQVWQEESAAPILQDLSNEGMEDASCSDDGCAVSEKNK